MHIDRRLGRRIAALLPFALAACVTTRGAQRPSVFGETIPAAKALDRARAAASDPHADGRTLAEAGWVALIRGGDTQTAVKRWRAAVERDPAESLAHLGLAEAARARLDHGGAGGEYLALLERAPADPLAEVAIRRLPAVLGVDAATDADALRVLQTLLESPETHPRVRAFARDLVAWLMERKGELEAAMPFERGGAPAAWAVVGPFSRFSALAEDARFAPETEQRLRASYQTPVGTVSHRAIPTPDGVLSLAGDPEGGDVYYAMQDVRVDAGGPYLLRWRTGGSLRVEIDGKVVLDRDATADFPAEQGLVGLTLAPGTHRVVARILRFGGNGAMRLELLDQAARPAGTWSTAHLGDAPPTPSFADESGRPPVAVTEAPAGTIAWAKARLAADPTDALAAHLAAIDLFGVDDQAAGRMLAITLATAPDFSWARYLQARLVQENPAIPPDLRPGRSSRAAERAVKADPGHVAATLLLARIAVQQDRYDDAEPLLAQAEKEAPAAPEVGLSRAELLKARGLSLPARQAVDAALRLAPRSCGLRQAAYDARSADADVKATEAAAKALEVCGASGLSTWADDRARRGDLDAAVKAWQRILALDPAQVAPAVRLSELLVNAGRPEEAQSVLERTLAFWPRFAPLAKSIGQIRADMGDDAGAAKWREKALHLDPSDLDLRRSLAWQQGHELLDWGALDLEQAIRDYQAQDGHKLTGVDSAVVVDHAVVEAFADEPTAPVVVERVQNVTQVLTKSAIDGQGEVSLPDGAKVIAIYVRKPDGRVLEPETTGSGGGMSLRGLEIGDYVVEDYVLSHGPRALAMPGWTANAFYVRVYDAALYRSTYVARAPVSLGLEVDSRNLKVAKPVREGDTLVFRHESKDVPPLQQENDSVGGDEVLPWFQVGAGAGPESYGDVWGDYVEGRSQMTPQVRAFAEKVAKSLPKKARGDRAALVRAVAAAVDHEVRGRTSSVQLTDRGAYALVRGRGNRLLVTRTVLAALGVPSRVALVRPFQADPGPHRFPTASQYTYAVLRVDLGEGHYLWLDQNVRTSPIGTLRPTLSGQPALLLAERGVPTEIVKTPTFSREDERKDMKIRLVVDAAGNLTAEGEERYSGFAAAVVRTSLEQVNEARRKQVVESGLAQTFGPLVLDSLEFDGDGGDAAPGAPFAIKYRFRADHWARKDGARLLLPGGSLFPAYLSRRMIRSASRETPLLVDNGTIQHLEATIVLPTGASFVGGIAPAKVDTPLGTFERKVTADGSTLGIQEDLSLALTRVMPAHYGDLVQFCADVDEVQSRDLLAQLGGAGATKTAATGSAATAAR